jgi:hypothetical protein
MPGLLINLIIQIVARITSRHKLLGLWMILAFLWASAIAVQLPPPHRGFRPLENEPAIITAEQSCAKAPVEKHDACMFIAKIVGAPRLEGAAQYTSMEQIELMLGPPLGLLVLGFMLALIIRRVRGAPSAAGRGPTTARAKTS